MIAPHCSCLNIKVMLSAKSFLIILTASPVSEPKRDKKNSHRRRLVNETRAIALVQTGTQANQFASAIDRANNITNFAENRAGSNSFFSPLNTQRRPVLKFLRPYVTRKGMVTKTFHLRKQDPQNTSKFCLG